MQIAPISFNTNTNFGHKYKVRIPNTDGTTSLLTVTGRITKDGDLKITRIIGEILKKGKLIKAIEPHENKDGFGPESFAVISEELGKGAKEPDKVVDRIIEPLIKLDFN